jgi:hypothetical protein
MKHVRTISLFLVLIFPMMAEPQVSLAQRAKIQSLEGVVTDSWMASKGKVIIVESGGSKCWFSLANLYFGKDVIGEDATEIGTRVKVTYKSMVRSKDGTYEGTPLRIVSLTNSSTTASAQTKGDGFQAFYIKFRSAINSRNKTALKELMASRFDWAMDGYVSREAALQNIGALLHKAGRR